MATAPRPALCLPTGLYPSEHIRIWKAMPAVISPGLRTPVYALLELRTKEHVDRASLRVEWCRERSTPDQLVDVGDFIFEEETGRGGLGLGVGLLVTSLARNKFILRASVIISGKRHYSDFTSLHVREFQSPAEVVRDVVELLEEGRGEEAKQYFSPYPAHSDWDEMDSQYRAAFLATLRTGQFAGRDELETSNSVLRKTIPAFTGTSKSTIEMLTYWRQVVRMKEFYRVGNPDDHIEFYNTKRALGDVLSSYMDGYRLLFPGDLGVPLWFIDLSMDLETWIDIFRDDIFRDRTRSNFALNPALPK